MIREVALDAFIMFFGLAGGLAIGSGTVALLMVLDIIPRLAQLTRSYRCARSFEAAMVSGALLATFADFFDWHLHLPGWPLTIIGLLLGVFVGMLAAALTEVLNVLPILAKRMGISTYIGWLLMAMALGKLFGSLFDWLYYH